MEIGEYISNSFGELFDIETAIFRKFLFKDVLEASCLDFKYYIAKEGYVLKVFLNNK